MFAKRQSSPTICYFAGDLGNDVCESLSKKNLTIPSDMPMVLSSLAKDFANVLPGYKYTAGFWRSRLPHTLSWNSRHFKDVELEYVAPTWSWLPSGTSVTLANQSSVDAKHSIATILNESTFLKYDDPFDSVERGVLEVEGILRHTQLSFQDTTGDSQDLDFKVLEDYNDADEYEMWQEIGHSWNEYFGDACVLSLDTPLEEAILDCWCLFITIQQCFDSTASRYLACLVLKDSDGEEEIFRRIGIVVFKHNLGPKMRYWMTRDLDENDWNAIEKMINNRRYGQRENKKKERIRDMSAKWKL